MPARSRVSRDADDGLREQLCLELGRVLPDVPTAKLRTMVLAARVWAYPEGYDDEDGDAQPPLRLVTARSKAGVG